MLRMLPPMPLDAPVSRFSQTSGSELAGESSEHTAGAFAEALGASLAVADVAAKAGAPHGDEPDAVPSAPLLPVDGEGGKIMPNGRELPLPGHPALVQITDLAKANAAAKARGTPEDAATAAPPIEAGEHQLEARLAHEQTEPAAGTQHKSARNPAEPAVPVAASLHSDPAHALPMASMIEAAAPGSADGHDAVSPRAVAAVRLAPGAEPPMLSAPTPAALPAPLAAAVVPAAMVAPPPLTELAPDGAAPPPAAAAALALRKAKPAAAASGSLAEPAAPVSPALASPSSAAASAPVFASSPAMVSEAGAAHGASLGTPASALNAPDLAATIDQLDVYREAARGIRPELTLRHSEFGAVHLRLEAAAGVGPGEWRALLTSRDPGFVPAVQAALAERAVAASSESAGHSSAHSGGRGSEGGAGQGHSSGQSPYGSSPGSGQGSSQPYFAQTSAGARKAAAADAGSEDRTAPPVGASRGGLFA